jgi:uncharacterized membrane protein YkoI
MSKTLAATLVLSLLAPAAWSGAGDARPPRQPVYATHADGLTLDEAVAKVEAQYDARVVRAEEKQDDGRRVYRIRLLSADGRVFDVTVDAASGKVE